MEKQVPAKESELSDKKFASGVMPPKVKNGQEPMIPKGRYDCVNLALKDTKAMLQERTAEAELLKSRVSELEEKLSCIVTIAKWFKAPESGAAVPPAKYGSRESGG